MSWLIQTVVSYQNQVFRRKYRPNLKDGIRSTNILTKRVKLDKIGQYIHKETFSKQNAFS